MRARALSNFLAVVHYKGDEERTRQRGEGAEQAVEKRLEELRRAVCKALYGDVYEQVD